MTDEKLIELNDLKFQINEYDRLIKRAREIKDVKDLFRILEEMNLRDDKVKEFSVISDKTNEFVETMKEFIISHFVQISEVAKAKFNYS